ncbi:hypothetical protein FSP39_000962 [Pinctada imbricata]|uniref:NHR domain-containing protein n=1 Tax=Pinctada imbricata TaxID=66713 RepID=A0AA88XUW7_PINIB|nr:hypothetical protein FSP39_000962 [Pinctada imbricata]
MQPRYRHSVNFTFEHPRLSTSTRNYNKLSLIYGVCVMKYSQKAKLGRMKDSEYIIMSRQLQDAIEEIQNLSTSVYEGRQGETTSMIEYANEMVVACYGQADPLLKELQSIKFMLVDGKYKDVISKMDGQMNKLLKCKETIRDNTEIATFKTPQEGYYSKTSELQLVPCGENLQLSENCRGIKWHQIYSGGLVFSHRPLSKLELISLRMTGSGSVAIGITQSDPNRLYRNIGKMFQENQLTIGINVKLLDSSRDVSMRIGGDIDDNKVFLVSEKERYTVTKKPGQTTWLVVYLRFGDVRVELVPDIGKVLRFSETIGHNIQLTEGNKRKAKLIEENISATCRLSRRIYCGEEVTFQVRPLKDKDTLPKMFSVNLGITTEGLQNGSFYDDNPFTAASRSWAIRTYLDNQNCLGKIHVAVSISGLVSMANAKGICGNAHLTREERQFGVAIIFQLFRCKLDIVAYKIKES